MKYKYIGDYIHRFLTLCGLLSIYSDLEEILANRPFSPFSIDFEIFNGLFLTILHRL